MTNAETPENEEEEEPQFTMSEAIELCEKICESIKDYYRTVYRINDEDDDECDDPSKADPYDCNDCYMICRNMAREMKED
ncbi:MAG: hypothetical protein QXX36_03090 [Candidatus Rehaiarchaeum fermentans]|nr:hypothetical protein [Candidatus Rehaiarchaeum fermentans]